MERQPREVRRERVTQYETNIEILQRKEQEARRACEVLHSQEVSLKERTPVRLLEEASQEVLQWCEIGL